MTYRAPREVLVPEGGGLFEREEDAADGRAERGRDAGGGAGAHEVALVDVVAEVREELGEEGDAALRDDRADRRARVDHRALLRAQVQVKSVLVARLAHVARWDSCSQAAHLSHCEPSADGQYDAGNFTDERAEAEQPVEEHAVQVALDLRDAATGGHWLLRERTHVHMRRHLNAKQLLTATYAARRAPRNTKNTLKPIHTQ